MVQLLEASGTRRASLLGGGLNDELLIEHFEGLDQQLIQIEGKLCAQGQADLSLVIEHVSQQKRILGIADWFEFTNTTPNVIPSRWVLSNLRG